MMLKPKSLLTVASLASVMCWAAAVRAEDEPTEEPAPQVGQGQPRRTLAERIPSVTHRAFTKRGRVELLPSLGLSLSDPFYRYAMGGATLSYHLRETLAIGLSADYLQGFATPPDISGRATTATQGQAFNRPVYAARAQVSWSPLYGKISWLAESVLHFDTYLTVGGGVVSPKQGGTTPAGSLALGQHYFLNNWVALRFELRDELYRFARNVQDPTTLSLQNLLSASVGVCFYFPEEAKQEDQQ